MEDFLSHPVWSGISGIVGIIGIVLTVATLASQSNQQRSVQSTYREAPSYSSPSIFEMPFTWMVVVMIAAVVFTFSTKPTQVSTWRSGSPLTTPTNVAPIIRGQSQATTNAIILENRLLLPIRFSLDTGYQDTLYPQQSMDIPISSSAATVSFEVPNQTNTGGEVIGHTYPNFSVSVQAGESYSVTNILNEIQFFYPVVTNNTTADCSLVINEGVLFEDRPRAFIPAGANEIGLGYYRLLQDSNVVFNCGDAGTWYFGMRGGPNDRSFVTSVTPGSGKLVLTFPAE